MYLDRPDRFANACKLKSAVSRKLRNSLRRFRRFVTMLCTLPRICLPVYNNYCVVDNHPRHLLRCLQYDDACGHREQKDCQRNSKAPSLAPRIFTATARGCELLQCGGFQEEARKA